MAGRMGRIIRNLRAFARQESTAQDRVDLTAALQSALDLTRGRCEAAGVDIRYDPSPQAVWVRGGEVRLGQVFVNLISNAVDAMEGRAEQRLEIDVTRGETVAVTFRDTGPGIEMPDKVFDPFYTTKQADETAGMGLGLSISYGIVQSIGGQIKGSNHAGGGAVFTVTLEPAAAEAAAA